MTSIWSRIEGPPSLVLRPVSNTGQWPCCHATERRMPTATHVTGLLRQHTSGGIWCVRRPLAVAGVVAKTVKHDNCSLLMGRIQQVKERIQDLLRVN